MMHVIDTNGNLALALLDTSCTCPECGRDVEQDNMKKVEPNKLCCHNSVCSGCYENLESDDDDGE